MNELWLVFEGGGSDETLIGVFKTKDAAMKFLSTSASTTNFACRYGFSESASEFLYDETEPLLYKEQ